jgi:hypothetical protein
MSDPLARFTAVAGVVLAAISLLWQVAQAWTRRHRVNILLDSASSPAEDFAVVVVRNIGRPVAVEQIWFDWRDPRPEPADWGWETSLDPDDSIPYLGLGAPDIPFLLADGETRKWAFMLEIGKDLAHVYWNPEEDAITAIVRAEVQLSSGKTLTSKDGEIHFRSAHL